MIIQVQVVRCDGVVYAVGQDTPRAVDYQRLVEMAERQAVDGDIIRTVTADSQFFSWLGVRVDKTP